ncbi:MAG: ComEC/Rec2 family competence protein [Clostridia bacterium]|nr:ComEC/Rec2 family competence protein [Clostridia bacterium]
MIAHFRPMLFAFLFLALGVYIGDLYYYNSSIYLCIALIIFGVCGVLILIYWITRYNVLKWFWVNKYRLLVCLVALIIGVGMYAIEYNTKPSNFESTEGAEYSVVGVVANSYQDRGDYINVFLDEVVVVRVSTGVVGGENEVIKLKDRMLVYIMITNLTDANKVYAIRPGDTISMKAEISNTPIFTENGYSSYGYKYNYQHTVQINDEDVLISPGTMGLMDSVREEMRIVLKQSMSEDMAELAYSVLTGDATDVDETIMTNFLRTGITHIIAVSGMNVVFIAVILRLLMRPFKLKEKWQIIIIIIVLILYCALCGYAVPVTRATLMYVFLMFGKIFGYQTDGLSSVSLSGIVLMAISPLVIFDVSFLLSFSSVYAIMMLMPVMQTWYRGWKFQGMWDAISMTIAAQIGTLPFLVNTFGEVSIIGLIANVVIVPAFGYVYMILFVAIFLALIIPIFEYVLWLVQWGLWITNYASGILAGVSFAVSKFPSFYDPIIFTYLLAMFGCSYNYLSSKKSRIITVTTLGIVTLIGLCASLVYIGL